MNRREIEELAAELRGRRWDESDGKRVLDAWKKSGETVSAFAQRLGVSGQRLSWWQRRLGDSPAGSSPAQGEQERTWAAPILLPVTIRDEQRASRTEAAVVVEVGAVRIEVRDVQVVPVQWLSVLLGSLREGVS